MHPKPFEPGPTVNQQIHVSFNREDLSDAFLAGLLSHLRSISAILLGGYDSYDCNAMFYGKGDVKWARGRYSPIYRASNARFEIRVPDALFNPYLQVASIIGVGLDGIRNGMKLEMKEYPMRLDKPLSEAEKNELGVTDKIPASLSEAAEAMGDNSAVLKEVFGDKCFETLLAHRKGEVRKHEVMTRAEMTKAIIQEI